ncbi:MAG TPA: calcium/proton exchanger [Syntrophomonas sp.]|nr:calcium/proton exchanger [Syntrophomonas sp.]
MGKVLNYLLFAIPLSIYCKFAGLDIFMFFTACLAIIPLAGIMGEATENLACYLGERAGGFLNATFGNATELLITIFALQAGLFDVVKASIAGSILGNILLVLGLSIFVGGLKNGEQRFDRVHVNNQTNLMFLAMIALIVPAVFFQAEKQHYALEGFSLAVAAILLILYFAGLVFAMHRKTASCESEPAKWSKTKAIAMLALSTIFIALESEYLVSGIESVTATLGWSSFFIGIIIIPIIGNAAEHFTAITMAMKNKINLSFEIAVGSSTQIAMLVTPVLVFLSLAFGQPMSMMFNYHEIVVVGLAVLSAQFISQDGESNWLEGLMLVAAYLIIAIAFFYM